MSGRGRGRGGWGRGGGFNTFASQAVTLPDVNLDDIHDDTKKLLRWDSHLQNYWEASPYFLEDKTSKKRQSMHIAKFSDRKKNDFTRDSLSQVLMFNDFPQELVQGASKRASRRKKFRWNPESEMKKLDFFEQQEKTNQVDVICNCCHMQLWPPQHRWDFLYTLRCNKLLQPQIDTSTTSSAAFIITTIYCHCHCEHCRNLCHSTDAIIVVTTSANPVSIASTTVAINFIITTSSIIALLLPPSPLLPLLQLSVSKLQGMGKEENDENEKKDGEDGDEDENAQEEDEEDISDDDYNQNIDFDDDEDDYNDVDDGDGIMNLPIRYQYGECSSAHPVTAIQAWTVAPLILQFGS
ncbi:hypothetical protein GmHk_15G043959 [Glycine max]|nr:hypothetical protein GmHk_15G043959 [Glycine max]